ncbi:MAG: hypothetical protein ACRDFC_09610, partial [Ignavibacteria bacterium]
MIHSKALEIIKGLSKIELHRFERFLESPFFNPNRKLPKLCRVLEKYYPEFDSAKFTKEDVFRRIYGNEKYNDARLRKVFSDLYKEAERFLVILKLDENKEMYHQILLGELDSRKLDNLFFLKYEESNEHLDKGGMQYDYFLEKHLLDWLKITFHLERGEQNKIALQIYERSEHLIFYFLSDLFLTLNDIHANRRGFNFSHEPDLPGKFIECLDVNSFFEFVNKYEIKNKVIVQLYFHAYLMNKNFDKEEYFFEFKKFAEENINKFNKFGQMTL